MGRGVSCGGGQSSLGYLFGTDGPAAKPVPKAAPLTASEPVKNAINPTEPVPNACAPKDISADVPKGAQGSNANNYFRAEGQNCGNFLTDRPSTKVHSAPGGGSSLGYLFGGPPSGN